MPITSPGTKGAGWRYFLAVRLVTSCWKPIPQCSQGLSIGLSSNLRVIKAYGWPQDYGRRDLNGRKSNGEETGQASGILFKARLGTERGVFQDGGRLDNLWHLYSSVWLQTAREATCGSAAPRFYALTDCLGGLPRLGKDPGIDCHTANRLARPR